MRHDRLSFAVGLLTATLAGGCAIHEHEIGEAAAANPASCCTEGSGKCCCAGESKQAESKGGAPNAAASASDPAKIAQLERQAALAQKRFERSQMDVEQQERDGQIAVRKAKVELDSARDALQHFQGVEVPQKVARSELDLKGAQDNAQESAEEMQQLELMYQKDDLADKTKEIVLARGKRRLERAQQGLALQQKEVDDLKSFQLPEQRKKLELAVAEKEADLHRAQFQAETGLVDKKIAVEAAQGEVEKTKSELEQAKAKS